MGKKMRTVASDGQPASLFHTLHAKKSGTPTMGGILIWGSVLLVVLLSLLLNYIGIFEHSLIEREETYLPLFTLIAAALLGAVDDLFNVREWGKSKGLNIRPKFFWLILFAALGAWWFYFKLGFNSIHIPLWGDFELGLWYIPLFMFIFVATTNSVNITDGLDGLAGGLSIIAFGGFAIIAYIQGLLVLSAFCTAICGATLAFLWFNIQPARFIMGDTGSLALGATLGVIAMVTNSVAILPFLGFIFVIETLSVLLQMASKKWRRKKLFHIAPLHHHLEHIGWPEAQVVMRFWIIGGLFASIGVILGLIGLGNL